MIRSFRAALAVMAAIAASMLAAPASAQTFTLPEIGLQNSGGCPQFAVRDRASKAMVPIGCVTANGAGFKATPTLLFAQIVPPVDTSLSTRFGVAPELYNNPNVIAFAPGNMVSFCPTQSCVTEPTNDHQRASLLVSATTQDDAHSEEQTLAVITTINKGRTKKWANATSFVAGDNIDFQGPNTIYRQTQASCTSAASGSFPSTNKGTGIADGTCRWDWINDSAINAKVGIYNEIKNKAGGGSSWAQANNFELAPGHTPSFNINTEFDFSNHTDYDCVPGVANCHNLYIAMNGKRATSAIDVFSNNKDADGPATYWGMRMRGDNFASEMVLDITAKSKVGLGFGATTIGTSTFTEAALRDKSTSPVSFDIGGSHTNGLVFSGTFSGAQIAGNNFTVFPDGGTQVTNLNVKPDAAHQVSLTYNVGSDRSEMQSTHLGSFNTELALNPLGGVVSVGGGFLKEASAAPASSSAACIAGTRTWDSTYEYRCVATNTWKRAALSSW